jgi:hypothetical protein
VKLLLENWREYLDEGLKPGPGMTIADLVDLIHTGRQLEQGDDLDKIMSKLAMVLGEEFVAWPLVGIGIAAASMAAGGDPAAAAVAGAALPAAHRLLGDFYRKKRKDGFFKDDPKEYPVLDLLDMDPEFKKRYSDTWLKEADKAYEQYLDTRPPEDPLSEVIDIDDFIRDLAGKQLNKADQDSTMRSAAE